MNPNVGKHLSFPFRVGTDGRAVQISTLEEHVRDEIVQLLLTNPAERLFVPEFGGGVRRLVFEPADESTTGAMAKALITQNIRRWLGHRVTLERLEVKVENETIEVEIIYRIAGTENKRALIFQRSGG
jgi:phage baseplate assembly protein W